jgi:electron transfer flavoprotein beta subunit
MKAKRKEIEALPVASLLKAEARTATTSFHPPAKKGGGVVLEGDVGVLADQLVGILKDKTAVLR